MPKVFEFLIEGIKKPDCLLTLGSGWDIYGKYMTGTSYIFNQAFLYSIIFFFLLCFTSSDFINQGGHFSFSRNLHEVNTPFLITVSSGLSYIEFPKILGSFSKLPKIDLLKKTFISCPITSLLVKLIAASFSLKLFFSESIKFKFTTFKILLFRLKSNLSKSILLPSSSSRLDKLLE